MIDLVTKIFQPGKNVTQCSDQLPGFLLVFGKPETVKFIYLPLFELGT